MSCQNITICVEARGHHNFSKRKYALKMLKMFMNEMPEAKLFRLYNLSHFYCVGNGFHRTHCFENYSKLLYNGKTRNR